MENNFQLHNLCLIWYLMHFQIEKYLGMCKRVNGSDNVKDVL